MGIFYSFNGAYTMHQWKEGFRIKPKGGFQNHAREDGGNSD